MTATTAQAPERPPETIDTYLAALRQALAGCRPGVIADALADCEEHLRSELAAKPDRSEAQMLRGVVETYGTPAEIAEEYRAMEESISGPFPRSETPERRGGGFFGIVSDPTAYGALLYMLLSLATGIFYFTWAVTGLALTVGFSILIIGIPFALLFIGSIRLLSHVEGRIVEGLLGVRMPRRLPAEFDSSEGIWGRIKDAITDVRTWSSLLYLMLMLPLGIAYFVTVVVGLSFSLGIAGGSIWSLITGDASHIRMDDLPWLDHLLHTAPGLFLAAILGVLLFFVVLHLAKGIGWLHGRIAEVLLVRL